MIEIVGEPGSEEYETAVQLGDALERLWPGISKSQPDSDHVRIAPNTKLSGYRVSDIDVVVVARLAPGRAFVPRRKLRAKDGTEVGFSRVAVHSFVAAIEVKSQPSAAVRFEGEAVKVRYSKRASVSWKDATEQNVQQVFALQGYLKDRGTDVFVYRCLCLSGLDVTQVAGTIAGKFSASDFLWALASVNGVQNGVGGPVIASASSTIINAVLEAPLLKAVLPSNLDRKRMDRISAPIDAAREIAGQLGETRVHLRGEGGAGKTVLLLQAAWQAYKLFGKRTLLLTYNQALSADIKRQLALLRVPSGLDGGGIEVRTIMSFVMAWMRELEVATEASPCTPENYDEKCEEFADLLAQGVVTSAEIANARAAGDGAFDFDAIVIDEAQDLPQAEAAILCALYGEQAISIADGGSQLVRGRPTNWRMLDGRRASQVQPMRRCMRMKANIARFVKTLAELTAQPWDLNPNSDAPGGRIIIVDGRYTEHEALHERLVQEAIAAGNSKVDLLYCVPATGVTEVRGAPASLLGLWFQAKGEKVWDGVDSGIRSDFPRSIDEFRIVQFDSCRGLEGWTVVLDGIDEFWSAKHSLAEIRTAARQGLRSTTSADEEAWQRCMIALTRPIDTLVICCRSGNSGVGRVLEQAARRHGDFVEFA